MSTSTDWEGSRLLLLRQLNVPIRRADVYSDFSG